MKKLLFFTVLCFALLTSFSLQSHADDMGVAKVVKTEIRTYNPKTGWTKWTEKPTPDHTGFFIDFTNETCYVINEDDIQVWNIENMEIDSTDTESITTVNFVLKDFHEKQAKATLRAFWRKPATFCVKYARKQMRYTIILLKK